MISGVFKKNMKSAVIAGAVILGGSAHAQLGLNWTEMGPNDLGGRCRSIIVDKMDGSGNTIFAAGVSGGVFKSNDFGANWFALNDQAPSLIVSCMAQANDGTIFLGTGETFSRGGNGAGLSGFIGTGLYKFASGTANITLVGDSSVFGNINEVAIAPSSSSVIYVAAQKGFFVSIDGGTTFFENAVTTGSNNPAAMDVKVAIDGGVYVAVGKKSDNNSKVYYCAAGGNGTYNDVTPTLPSPYTYGRIEIATSPSDANYVYVSIAKQFTNNAGGGLSGVFVSDNKGSNWSVVTLGTTQLDPFTSISRSFGDYSHVLVVHPTDPGTFYLAGYGFKTWKRLASGSIGQGDWDNVYGVHSQIHDIKYDAPRNQWFVATDGGLYKSVTSTGTPYIIGGFFSPTPFLHFSKGLNITQFNSVSFQKEATSSSTVAANFVGMGGGTIGNDFVYLPGDLNTSQSSSSFGSTDAYQSDFSGILPRAMFYAGPFGALYRTNDVKNSVPGSFTDTHYDLAATGGPGASTFGNEDTPARLWENYGGGTADSIIFYNPQVKSSFVNSSTTQKTFTITNQRPQKSARYQQITIVSQSTVTSNQTITIVPQYESARKIGGYTITGTSTNTNMVIIGDSSLIDQIVFTFTTAPNTGTVTAYLDLYYVPGPDVINNTAKTTTVTGVTKFWTAVKRPTFNGKYQSVTAVDPTNSQTITIMPAYSGTAITSYTVAGATSTYNLIQLHNKNIYSLYDTIRFEFDTAPTGTNTSIAVTTVFEPSDSIVVKYDDISGMPYTTGIPITSVFTNTTVGSTSPHPIKKLAAKVSARYAVGVGGSNPSIYVVKRPLNFSINPLFIKVAGPKSRIDSVANMASTKTRSVVGTPTKIEWAPDGQNLYFATKQSDTAYFFYRISHLNFIGDSSDYSGIFTSDIDSSNKVRLGNPIRTTPLGKFKYPITGITVKPDNSSVLITCGGYTNQVATLFESVGDIRTATTNSISNSNFISKNGTGLPLIPAYTSLYEMGDNKRVLVGTETGMYSTLDITQASPTWVKENNNQLPNVPIFQIRQQTLPNWLSQNSGIIYVATHGRGIWATKNYFSPYAIGIEEVQSKPTFGSNMVLYPNPANDQINVWFNAKGDASYTVSVYDINGRVVIQEKTSKLLEGEQTLQINTATLNSGVYFVSITGSNNFNATSKLIISK